MRIIPPLLLGAALCAALPDPASAALRSLAEGELAAVTGRAGISIDLDLGMRVSIGSIAISDSSSTPNWLTLSGVTIDNGSGGNFLVKTSDSNFNIFPTTLDVGTDGSGRSTLTISDASRINPRYYGVDDIVFAGQQVGSLHIGPVTEGASTLVLSAPATGSGVLLDYTTRIDIGSFRYGYNSSEALALSGVHLAGSASGAAEDPSSWSMTGDFHLGPLPTDSSNPASLAVSTDQNGVSSTSLNLPLQGSIRVEDLSFGSTSFGPMAIDGINAHRLQIRFTP